MNTRQIVAVIGMILIGLPTLGRAEEDSAADPGWGSIDGQFLLDGPFTPQLVIAKGAAICAREDLPDESLVVDPTTHGIANIFVYLRKAPDRIHPDRKVIPAKAELTAKGCRFVPHCGILRVEQNLNVKFTENVAHHAHFNPVASVMPGTIVRPYDPAGIDYCFDHRESLPMRVTCDYHSW